MSGVSVDAIRAAEQAARSFVTGTGRELHSAQSRCPNLDDGFTARVAAKYEQLVSRPADPAVQRAYQVFRAETREQYDAIGAAGVQVLPWTRPGQPYRSARQMCSDVNSTGILYVYLTAAGHGPDADRDPANPLLAPSGVTAGGEPLLNNDLFRAVHDFFGHGLRADGFSLRGELRAAYHHFQMYSTAAHPALFNEAVAQICWFYSGTHLVSPDGIIPQAPQDGWLPPAQRPYPPQKVAAFPLSFVEDFLSRFQLPAAVPA